MMPLLWVPVVPVCVRLSVWPKPVSTLLVFPSFSLREVILSPLRVVSTQLSESGCFPLCVPRLVGSLNRSVHGANIYGYAACTKTTGDGTCTIRLRVPTGWVTRTPFTT